jgi:putative nucleotidyltransferase with HDIG domain
MKTIRLRISSASQIPQKSMKINMATCDIFKILDGIDDIPTLPAVAMEVNKLLEDYNTSIKQLSNTIEKDQSIVFKLLKLANSAFFGLRSKVSNVPHAITLLGFNTVRNAVISISLIDAFAGKKLVEGFDIKKFWTHSVAVAVTSKHLAERTGLKSTDQSFVGGLLHDMGKIVLASYFHDLIEEIWSLTKENNLTFYHAEKEKGIVDHAKIGGYLAEKWRLPECLSDSTKYHHMDRKGCDPELQMIVHTADTVINAWHPETGSACSFQAWDEDDSGILKFQMDSLSEWFPEAAEEINSACQFFISDGNNG